MSNSAALPPAAIRSSALQRLEEIRHNVMSEYEGKPIHERTPRLLEGIFQILHVLAESHFDTPLPVPPAPDKPRSPKGFTQHPTPARSLSREKSDELDTLMGAAPMEKKNRRGRPVKR